MTAWMRPARLAPAVLLVLAVALWALSLRGIDLAKMSDLGLVSVLPASAYLALAILCLSFAVTAGSKSPSVPLLALHVATLIVLVYGVTAMIEHLPRFNVVYRIAGYTEYIARTGSVDPRLDAYFSWPGLFAVTAMVDTMARTSGVLDYAAWAPVVFNLLYVAPLVMLFESFTRDARVIWLGVWIFFLINWVGQDYFSPQGLNLLFYLGLVAILVRWFMRYPALSLRPSRRQQPWLSRLRRVAADQVRAMAHSRSQLALVVVILVTFVGIVMSHPLTPFFAIVTVGALVVFRRTTLPWLPFVMVIVNVVWILTMAQPFLAGHASMVFGTLFNVGGNVGAGVTDRVQGSFDHRTVLFVRIALSAFVWAAALAGWLVARRSSRVDITPILLMVAPFLLIPLQAYGGEMFLRVFLFTLAPASFLLARLILAGSQVSWSRGGITLAASLLLLGAFLVARFGNERIDYITPSEFAGVRHLYDSAPPGSLLVATGYVPWQFRDFEKYRYGVLDETTIARLDVAGVQRIMRSGGPRVQSYFLYTRSANAEIDMFQGTPRQPPGLVGTGSLDRLVAKMLSSGKFKLQFQNSDCKILVPASTS